MGIIDMEGLERAFIRVNTIMEEEGLNSMEKMLVIDTLKSKLEADSKKRQAQDLLGSIPLGGFAKRFFKEQKEEKE